MKISTIKEYPSILRQLKHNSDERKQITFLSAVDTTRASVQTSSTSNATYSSAMRLLELDADDERLLKKKKSIDDFIAEVEDEETKEILKYCRDGYSNRQIASIMSYSVRTIERKYKKVVT